MATSVDPTSQVPPLEHPLEDGWTLPASWYSDADVAALERERIFARSWQYAGPAEQVAEPGSFIATAGGPHPRRRHARPGRHAARVRQRLPPPRPT